MQSVDSVCCILKTSGYSPFHIKKVSVIPKLAPPGIFIFSFVFTTPHTFYFCLFHVSIIL